MTDNLIYYCILSNETLSAYPNNRWLFMYEEDRNKKMQENQSLILEYGSFKYSEQSMIDFLDDKCGNIEYVEKWASR